MKNIRKFNTTAEMDNAVLTEPYVLHNEETGLVYTNHTGNNTDKMKNYFQFTAVEDTGFMLLGIDVEDNWSKTTPVVNLEISIDGSTWNAWDFQPTELLAGETVYFRGNNPDGFSKVNMYDMTGVFHNFMLGEGKIECHGNIMSLLYSDDFEDKLTIPCDSCFIYLFAYCTSLTTAPELPATTLTDGCYEEMFIECTSLTKAPELPATTLVEYCYAGMFESCTNLNHITMLATDISATYCLNYWVNNVSSTGTFYKNPDMNDLPLANVYNEYVGIPEGWVVMDYSPFTFTECTSLSITADDVVGNQISTTVYYTATVNGVDKDGNIVTGIIINGVGVSNEFEQNLSETETIERVVSFEFMGLTATTTITQGVYAHYLTFVALKDCTFSFTKNGTGDDIQYLLGNGGTWVSLESGKNTPTIKTGNQIMWKSTITPTGSGIGTFSSTGSFEANGNVMSLLFGDDYTEQTDLTGKQYAFYKLFSHCFYLTTAPETPATTLADSCYYGMFSGCTSLTTAPSVLPATTLANECYSSMFQGCKSLTTAPELPATTLAERCYENMFDGCTTLTTAPELPATTLSAYCYQWMFCNCKSLTTAPELPATTLANNCYEDMFNCCTSLKTAPELPATTLAERCYDGMFVSCTSLTTAPELPATTLAEYCYANMFWGCILFTKAPELSATSLTKGCYASMFSGCTSLTTAPELPATTLAKSCYESMFWDCTSLTTAPELPATTLAERCYATMFVNCKSLVVAPELPATTLADTCYNGMLSNCTSLTTAPELPATTLVKSCYASMFNGSTNLSKITMLATDISAEGCLSYWVSGVSSTGTFYKNPEMTSLPSGTSGIPKYWTVVNYQSN